MIWCDVCRAHHPEREDGRADLQSMPLDEVALHKRNMVRRSRQRHDNREGKIRTRAIELAARHVRENDPALWTDCLKQARGHVNRYLDSPTG